MKETKTGRPRRYDFAPPADIPNRDVGFAVAALREMAARVFDQVSDLPLDGLDFAPPGTTLSIGRLIVHLAWGEAGWMSRLGRVELKPELHDRLREGRLQDFDSPPGSYGTAQELIALCKRVQEEVTTPAAAALTDIDAANVEEARLPTARSVLTHLAWHWTFHSGHIGLIRLQWGSDYVWTFPEG